MKILIQNYSSYDSTEPMYFNACLSKTGCVTPYLWNIDAISTFDVIDKTTPDLLLCKYDTPALNDIIKYLSGNKNIELLFNITGINQNKLDLLEEIIEDKKIACKAFISNYHPAMQDVKSKNTKIINLLPAADIFLNAYQLPEYKLEAALISNNKDLLNKRISKYKSYHKMHFGIGNDDFFDMNINLNNLASLYDKYEEFVLIGNSKMIFSQLFFDCTLRSKRTTLVSQDNDLTNTILGSLFRSEESAEDISAIIKRQVKQKHNCVYRTAKLMNDLGNKNAAKILEEASKKI